MLFFDIFRFPFDSQVCHMKFGSWSYNGHELDLVHMHIDPQLQQVHQNPDCVENGIDLSDYYINSEWEIIGIPGNAFLDMDIFGF